MHLNRFTFIIGLLLSVQLLYSVENDNKPDSTSEGLWKNDVIGGFTLTQAQFDNWGQGGENSFSWQISVNSNFEYQTLRHLWTNTADLKFGQSRLGGIGTRKAADEIRLESVYQYTIGAHINPYTSINFQSQFARGYRYLQDTTFAISDFMDPGYITLGSGAGSSPFEGFNTRLGAAYKITIVDQYARRLTDGDRIATEFGLNSVTNFRKRLAENILLTTRLELFSNLNRFDEVDVRWEIIVSAKVTRYIDVRLNTELFYDKSVSKKRQFKQVLAVGLSYTFI